MKIELNIIESVGRVPVLDVDKLDKEDKETLIYELQKHLDRFEYNGFYFKYYMKEIM